MNKIINSFSLFIILIYSFLAFGSINDLNISVYTMRSIPFLTQIIHGLTLVVLLLGLIRIKRRWEGIRDIMSFEKFNYTTRLSKRTIGMSTMFIVLEICFMLFFILLSLDSQKIDKGTVLLPMFAVLTFLIAESFIFMYKFRTSDCIKLGVNKNLVAYFNREMHIYYFDGLQQISVYQNRLHFEYKKNLHLFMELDIIPQNELENFKLALTQVLKDKNIFFDESYREFVGVTV